MGILFIFKIGRFIFEMSWMSYEIKNLKFTSIQAILKHHDI